MIRMRAESDFAAEPDRAGHRVAAMKGNLQRSLSRLESVGRGGQATARDWTGLLRAAVEGWVSDRAASMGAAIAYYTVFSLAPILILIIAVAGFIYGERAAAGAVIEEVADLVGKESAGAVHALLRSANGTTSGVVATAIGIAALLLAATGVFGELQAALNVIWKVHPATRKGKAAGIWNIVRKRLRSLALIMVIGALLTISLALNTALTAFGHYFNGVLPHLSTILHFLDFAMSFGMTTVLFAMMFKVLPDAPVEWRDVWIGAAVTALLFSIGKYFISLYVGSSGVKSAYHAAGALVLILVWIYYSAQILLFGAEFAKAYGDRRRAKRAAESPEQKSLEAPVG